MGSPSKTIARYAEKIQQLWHKTLEDIFAVCDLVLQAHDDLSDEQWDDLLDELPFSEEVARKLMLIAADKRLRKPSVLKLLPPSYSIIYEVQTLKGPEFTTAISQKKITPEMRRSEFISWRTKLRRQPRAQYDGIPIDRAPPVEKTFASIVLKPTKSRSISALTALKQELLNLNQRHSVTVHFGDQQREAVNEARKAVAETLRAEFFTIVNPRRGSLDAKERDSIESAVWQHRLLAAGDPLPYSDDHPASIEHPKHPFGTKAGWDEDRLLAHLQDQNIVTPWNGITNPKQRAKAECLKLAYQFLSAKDEKSKRALIKVAKGNGTDAVFAKHCLDRVTVFDEA